MYFIIINIITRDNGNVAEKISGAISNLFAPFGRDDFALTIAGRQNHMKPGGNIGDSRNSKIVMRRFSGRSG